jgi:hypothetical protein
LTNGVNGNILVGTSNPGLGALANNGGPTQTIALLAGSPVLGAGSSTIPGVTVPTTDQRGVAWPGGVVDIGAYARPPASQISPTPSVYTVTDTSDDPGDGGSLRHAIAAANADPNLAGSVIQFAIATSDLGYDATTGSWTITLNPSNGPLVLQAPSGPLMIDGPGAGSLTSSGGGVMEVIQDDPAAPVTVSGLTVSGGLAAYGGGISVNYGATLTVDGCSIANNTATGGGGGIENVGILTVTDGSTIADNSAGVGGGIENRGTLTVTGGSTIADNSASPGEPGGGIYNYAILTVSNSTIQGNTAYTGGGIFCYANSTTTIAGSTIEGNTARGYLGGGIAMQADFAGGMLTITDSTITGNSGSAGGGVSNRGGTITILGSTLVGNTATNSGGEGGGAIWNSGILTVADTTIEGNSTVGYTGGGITNDYLATVTGCTIDDNTAPGGGGIANTGGSATLTVINSTITSNSALMAAAFSMISAL